jgi:uncharacterized protein YjbI with pentapeptide repeats/predicted small metal-binding protein
MRNRDDVPGTESAAEGGGITGRTQLKDLDRLVALSSLGTPEAIQLRGETPAWLVRAIAKRIDDAAARSDLPAFLFGNGGRVEIDLAGMDLAGKNLRKADLSGADLSGADLSGADLSGANLSGADLSDARLQRADLSRANLKGAILVRTTLNDARMRGTILDEASLFRAEMDGVSLWQAKLRFAYLRKAVLRKAIVEDADLTGADLDGACLRGSVVAGTVLDEANVAAAEFDDAVLSRVDVASCLGLECRQLLHAWMDDVALPDWSADRLPETVPLAPGEGDEATRRRRPMVQFNCGTIMENCDARLVAPTLKELGTTARDHALRAHEIDTVPAQLMEKILTNARTVDAAAAGG